MNFYKIFLIIFFLSSILIISACKKDKDPTPIPLTPEELFYTNCGKIPPVYGCINGTSVFVPNAISANFDGNNDVLVPYAGDGIEEVISFIIYDESGSLVYEVANFWPNDPSHGWDGKLPDGSIQNGIYNYTISFATTLGEIGVFEGGVCVRTSLPVNCIENEKHIAWGTQYDGNGGFNSALPSYEDCE